MSSYSHYYNTAPILARGTGRTTKMLMEASEYKRRWGRVTVVIHDRRMLHTCQQIVLQHGLLLQPRDFYTIQEVERNLGLMGYNKDEIFIDHVVHEHFSAQVKRLSDSFRIAADSMNGMMLHQHTWKYSDSDDDEFELWTCGCGEREWRDGSDPHG